jgi:site-specific DNA recombinase
MGMHEAQGSCTNNRQIVTATLEDRVLSGLRERMLDPELVAIFVREYHDEHARRSIEARRSSAKLDRKVAEANAKIERLVAAISGGGAEFAEVKDALAQARADRDRAAAELLEIEALPVVALHPTIAADRSSIWIKP